jgi:dTDP-4-dehydrorhamnose reductase
MKILMFGASGQVAREIQRAAGTWRVTALDRTRADLADPGACARLVAAAEADVVINAAAHTAVDRAEGEPALANLINAESPGAMARAAADRGIPLLHLSSDYVFDGSGSRPWRPDDPTGPLGAYGSSKLAGERKVQAAGGVHAILRTSWVFSAHGSNFVKSMLRLGASRSELDVVADQIGGPTPARDIAQALLTMATALLRDQAGSGIYHFSGAPDVSWADFAREIFARSGLKVSVRDIASRDYPTPARRPGNSRLDCSRLTATFGIGRPDWRDGLDAVLTELGARV